MTTWRWASWAMGGVGCVSVTANVAPLALRLTSRILTPPWRLERRVWTLQDLLYPLHAALFSDASPGPIKYALGKVRPDFASDLRLPMTPPSEASKRAVDAALPSMRG